MSHVLKPVYFFLRQCWRWDIQRFSAHVIMFIKRVAVCNTHICLISHSDDIMESISGEINSVGVADVLCFVVKCVWRVPAECCYFSSRDSGGHLSCDAAPGPSIWMTLGSTGRELPHVGCEEDRGPFCLSVCLSVFHRRKWKNGLFICKLEMSWSSTLTEITFLYINCHPLWSTKSKTRAITYQTWKCMLPFMVKS